MSQQPDQSPEPSDDAEKKPGLLEVTHSILAALFGVQSAKNRERDFKRGKASDYIMVYVIMVIAMVIGMIITVNIVLSSATS